MIGLVGILGLAFALQGNSMLRAPAPVSVLSWIDKSQVPGPGAMTKDNSWILSIRLTVKPNGKLKRCEVEKSTGNAYLSQYTCAMLKERARLLPAVWTDGSSSFGVYRFHFVWTRGGGPPAVSHGEDLSVTVNHSIYAQRKPAIVPIALAVDASGQISDCATGPISSSFFDFPPNLVPVACDAANRKFRPTPAKDGSGHLVRSVQNALVTVTSN